CARFLRKPAENRDLREVCSVAPALGKPVISPECLDVEHSLPVLCAVARKKRVRVFILPRCALTLEPNSWPPRSTRGGAADSSRLGAARTAGCRERASGNDQFRTTLWGRLR